MRTRSSLEYTIPRGRNRRRSRQQKEAIPIVDKFPIQMARTPMADTSALTGGFESAIFVPLINAQNFELKSSLINLVQNRIFRGVSKFINFFFPPSKTTNLRNEITNFRQIAQESFSEAWERFKELLRKCPHHGFSLMHQLDTFYNSLSYNDQDSLNSAAGGNFLYKSPTEGLQIIENKSPKKMFTERRDATALEDKMTLTFRNEMNEMKNMMKALVPTPVPIKAVEESEFRYPTSYWHLITDNRALLNPIHKLLDQNQGTDRNNNASGSGTLPSNTIPNPRNEVKAITTRSDDEEIISIEVSRQISPKDNSEPSIESLPKDDFDNDDDLFEMDSNNDE
ncbi:reverse transcriptase domain-containing protein [Tanacetum coccineum]